VEIFRGADLGSSGVSFQGVIPKPGAVQPGESLP